MGIREYVVKHGRLVRQRGPGVTLASAAREAADKTLMNAYLQYRQRRIADRVAHQRPLLDELRERDRWCLLVFDAGRYDYLEPLLSDRYTGNVQRTFSAARDTFEWMSKVWQGDFEDVAYISGMVPVSDSIDHMDIGWYESLYDGINPGDSIGEIVKLWDTHWDTSIGTVTPESVTDVALDYADRDKLVVHYNQPHSPFIGMPKLLGHQNSKDAEPATGRPHDEPIWERVRRGDVSDEHLRMAYWGNAVRAIKAVEPLVRERETVVATADHGEALGEWGAYTHKRMPHPKRRIVPWQEITGVSECDSGETATETPTEKLQALGYL